MCKIIAICNQKGGVGKTTTCVNLAAGLGILEKKVLVIDTDPQANATISFGFVSKKLNNPALEFMNFVSILKNNRIQTNSPNVDLIPFLEDVDFFKQELQSLRFKKALEIISPLYDYVIIDCVPFFKTKNLEILVSSNSVIIPVQCDYYALEGLHKFLKTVRYVQQNLNSSLIIEGFLLTMFDKRVNLSKKVVLYIQSNFKELVFKTIINRNTKVSQAPGYGKTIIEHDIGSIGARDYLSLADEVIKKDLDITVSNHIPSIPEEQERIFIKRTFSKSVIHDSIIKRISFIKITETQETRPFPSDFNDLIGLSKYEIKKKIGLSNNNVDEDIWIYKFKNSINIVKKKYVYLYFEDETVKSFATKRFKIN
ncbi:conserved hypothetical protein [Tenacibaculum sediminilitoris]|uniref:ParA family protein n=1 Tax=Tenacibaculum sediminilitoris TaxID=1820334 RepID=UPI0038944AF4